MRTTVDLPDDLLRVAKREAVDSGRTLSQVVADALRIARARAEDAKRAPRTKLPTFKGDGVRRGVDLNSTAKLLDLMDGYDESS